MTMLMMVVMAMLVRVCLGSMGVPMCMLGLDSRMGVFVMIIMMRVFMHVCHRLMGMGMIMICHVRTSLENDSSTLANYAFPGPNNSMVRTIAGSRVRCFLPVSHIIRFPISSTHATHWSHTRPGAN